MASVWDQDWVEDADDETGHDNIPEATSTVITHDPVQLYLHQAAQEPLLTAEQEIGLAYRIQCGQRATCRLRTLETSPGRDQTDRVSLQPQIVDGQVAREQFITANVRLVINIAKRYQDQGLAFGDLIQEGNLGLLRATDKYDPTLLNPETGKPHRFSTYATFWIKQHISRAIAAQTRTVRLPTNLSEQVKKLYRIRGFCCKKMRVRIK